jgi:hypothetical protein
MMTLVHIDVHVRAPPIGVVGGAGRESSAYLYFSFVNVIKGRNEREKGKEVWKGTVPQPPKLVVCLGTRLTVRGRDTQF